jgi:hypothetical protein
MYFVVKKNKTFYVNKEVVIYVSSKCKSCTEIKIFKKSICYGCYEKEIKHVYNMLAMIDNLRECSSNGRAHVFTICFSLRMTIRTQKS